MAGTQEERREALSILLSLHSLRWQNRGGSDAFLNSAAISFHEELSSLALDRGWLRLFTLRLDGQPVASLYGFQYNRTFYFYQSGFDPDWASHSVGLVAMGLAIQKALEEGAQEYDLLHGAEEYKFHWARDKHELASLELYPPDGLGMAWRAANGARHSMKEMVRNMLPERMAALLQETRRRKAVERLYVSKNHQGSHFPTPS
jgi:CelD/BcsL family acetyltransferase involved in cellulose biosynthesis